MPLPPPHDGHCSPQRVPPPPSSGWGADGDLHQLLHACTPSDHLVYHKYVKRTHKLDITPLPEWVTGHRSPVRQVHEGPVDLDLAVMSPLRPRPRSPPAYAVHARPTLGVEGCAASQHLQPLGADGSTLQAPLPPPPDLPPPLHTQEVTTIVHASPSPERVETASTPPPVPPVEIVINTLAAPAAEVLVVPPPAPRAPPRPRLPVVKVKGFRKEAPTPAAQPTRERRGSAGHHTLTCTQSGYGERRHQKAKGKRSPSHAIDLPSNAKNIAAPAFVLKGAAAGGAAAPCANCGSTSHQTLRCRRKQSAPVGTRLQKMPSPLPSRARPQRPRHAASRTTPPPPQPPPPQSLATPTRGESLASVASVTCVDLPEAPPPLQSAVCARCVHAGRLSCLHCALDNTTPVQEILQLSEQERSRSAAGRTRSASQPRPPRQDRAQVFECPSSRSELNAGEGEDGRRGSFWSTGSVASLKAGLSHKALEALAVAQRNARRSVPSPDPETAPQSIAEHAIVTRHDPPPSTLDGRKGSDVGLSPHTRPQRDTPARSPSVAAPSPTRPATPPRGRGLRASGRTGASPPASRHPKPPATKTPELSPHKRSHAEDVQRVLRESMSVLADVEKRLTEPMQAYEVMQAEKRKQQQVKQAEEKQDKQKRTDEPRVVTLADLQRLLHEKEAEHVREQRAERRKAQRKALGGQPSTGRPSTEHAVVGRRGSRVSSLSRDDVLGQDSAPASEMTELWEVSVSPGTDMRSPVKANAVGEVPVASRSASPSSPTSPGSRRRRLSLLPATCEGQKMLEAPADGKRSPGKGSPRKRRSSMPPVIASRASSLASSARTSAMHPPSPSSHASGRGGESLPTLTLPATSNAAAEEQRKGKGHAGDTMARGSKDPVAESMSCSSTTPARPQTPRQRAATVKKPPPSPLVPVEVVKSPISFESQRSVNFGRRLSSAHSLPPARTESGSDADVPEFANSAKKRSLSLAKATAWPTDHTKELTTPRSNASGRSRSCSVVNFGRRPSMTPSILSLPSTPSPVSAAPAASSEHPPAVPDTSLSFLETASSQSRLTDAYEQLKKKLQKPPSQQSRSPESPPRSPTKSTSGRKPRASSTSPPPKSPKSDTSDKALNASVSAASERWSKAMLTLKQSQRSLAATHSSASALSSVKSTPSTARKVRSRGKTTVARPTKKPDGVPPLEPVSVTIEAVPSESSPKERRCMQSRMESPPTSPLLGGGSPRMTRERSQGRPGLSMDNTAKVNWAKALMAAKVVAKVRRESASPSKSDGSLQHSGSRRSSRSTGASPMPRLSPERKDLADLAESGSLKSTTASIKSKRKNGAATTASTAPQAKVNWARAILAAKKATQASRSASAGTSTPGSRGKGSPTVASLPPPSPGTPPPAPKSLPSQRWDKILTAVRQRHLDQRDRSAESHRSAPGSSSAPKLARRSSAADITAQQALDSSPGKAVALWRKAFVQLKAEQQVAEGKRVAELDSLRESVTPKASPLPAVASPTSSPSPSTSRRPSRRTSPAPSSPEDGALPAPNSAVGSGSGNTSPSSPQARSRSRYAPAFWSKAVNSASPEAKSRVQRRTSCVPELPRARSCSPGRQSPLAPPLSPKATAQYASRAGSPESDTRRRSAKDKWGDAFRALKEAAVALKRQKKEECDTAHTLRQGSPKASPKASPKTSPKTSPKSWPRRRSSLPTMGSKKASSVRRMRPKLSATCGVVDSSGTFEPYLSESTSLHAITVSSHHGTSVGGTFQHVSPSGGTTTLVASHPVLHESIPVAESPPESPDASEYASLAGFRAFATPPDSSLTGFPQSALAEELAAEVPVGLVHRSSSRPGVSSESTPRPSVVPFSGSTYTAPTTVWHQSNATPQGCPLTPAESLAMATTFKRLSDAVEEEMVGIAKTSTAEDPSSQERVASPLSLVGSPFIAEGWDSTQPVLCTEFVPSIRTPAPAGGSIYAEPMPAPTPRATTIVIVSGSVGTDAPVFAADSGMKKSPSFAADADFARARPVPLLGAQEQVSPTAPAEEHRLAPTDETCRTHDGPDATGSAVPPADKDDGGAAEAPRTSAVAEDLTVAQSSQIPAAAAATSALSHEAALRECEAVEREALGIEVSLLEGEVARAAAVAAAAADLEMAESIEARLMALRRREDHLGTSSDQQPDAASIETWQARHQNVVTPASVNMATKTEPFQRPETSDVADAYSPSSSPAQPLRSASEDVQEQATEAAYRAAAFVMRIRERLGNVDELSTEGQSLALLDGDPGRLREPSVARDGELTPREAGVEAMCDAVGAVLDAVDYVHRTMQGLAPHAAPPLPIESIARTAAPSVECTSSEGVTNSPEGSEDGWSTPWEPGHAEPVSRAPAVARAKAEQCCTRSQTEHLTRTVSDTLPARQRTALPTPQRAAVVAPKQHEQCVPSAASKGYPQPPRGVDVSFGATPSPARDHPRPSMQQHLPGVLKHLAPDLSAAALWSTTTGTPLCDGVPTATRPDEPGRAISAAHALRAAHRGAAGGVATPVSLESSVPVSTGNTRRRHGGGGGGGDTTLSTLHGAVSSVPYSEDATPAPADPAEVLPYVSAWGSVTATPAAATSTATLSFPVVPCAPFGHGSQHGPSSGVASRPELLQDSPLVSSREESTRDRSDSSEHAAATEAETDASEKPAPTPVVSPSASLGLRVGPLIEIVREPSVSPSLSPSPSQSPTPSPRPRGRERSLAAASSAPHTSPARTAVLGVGTSASPDAEGPELVPAPLPQLDCHEHSASPSVGRLAALMDTQLNEPPRAGWTPTMNDDRYLRSTSPPTTESERATTLSGEMTMVHPALSSTTPPVPDSLHFTIHGAKPASNDAAFPAGASLQWSPQHSATDSSGQLDSEDENDDDMVAPTALAMLLRGTSTNSRAAVPPAPSSPASNRELPPSSAASPTLASPRTQVVPGVVPSLRPRPLLELGRYTASPSERASPDEFLPSPLGAEVLGRDGAALGKLSELFEKPCSSRVQGDTPPKDGHVLLTPQRGRHMDEEGDVSAVTQCTPWGSAGAFVASPSPPQTAASRTEQWLQRLLAPDAALESGRFKTSSSLVALGEVTESRSVAVAAYRQQSGLTSFEGPEQAAPPNFAVSPRPAGTPDKLPPTHKGRDATVRAPGSAQSMDMEKWTVSSGDQLTVARKTTLPQREDEDPSLTRTGEVTGRRRRSLSPRLRASPHPHAETATNDAKVHDAGSKDRSLSPRSRASPHPHAETATNDAKVHDAGSKDRSLSPRLRASPHPHAETATNDAKVHDAGSKDRGVLRLSLGSAPSPQSQSSMGHTPEKQESFLTRQRRAVRCVIAQMRRNAQTSAAPGNGGRRATVLSTTLAVATDNLRHYDDTMKDLEDVSDRFEEEVDSPRPVGSSSSVETWNGDMNALPAAVLAAVNAAAGGTFTTIGPGSSDGTPSPRSSRASRADDFDYQALYLKALCGAAVSEDEDEEEEEEVSTDPALKSTRKSVTIDEPPSLNASEQVPTLGRGRSALALAKGLGSGLMSQRSFKKMRGSEGPLLKAISMRSAVTEDLDGTQTLVGQLSEEHRSATRSKLLSRINSSYADDKDGANDLLVSTIKLKEALGQRKKSSKPKMPKRKESDNDYEDIQKSDVLPVALQEFLQEKAAYTVFDELVENLVTTKEKGTAEHEKECTVRLCLGARAIATRDQSPTSLSLTELLVLWLYTAHGIDIDAMLGFDVPAVENLAEWNEYTERYQTNNHDASKRVRNGCLFGEINYAMRVMSAGGDSVNEGAKEVIRKWAKFISVLAAILLFAEPEDENLQPAQRGGLVLYRGFGGQSEAAFDAMTRQGKVLYWPAFSSLSLDRNVSISYIDGSAANAVAKRGHAVLFAIQGLKQGYPLWDISQYPDEREVLLPPMTYLRIAKVDASAEIQTRCLRELGLDLSSAAAVKACEVTLVIEGSLCDVIDEQLSDCIAECARIEEDVAGVLATVDRLASAELREKAKLERQLELQRQREGQIEKERANAEKWRMVVSSARAQREAKAAERRRKEEERHMREEVRRQEKKRALEHRTQQAAKLAQDARRVAELEASPRDGSPSLSASGEKVQVPWETLSENMSIILQEGIKSTNSDAAVSPRHCRTASQTARAVSPRSLACSEEREGYDVIPCPRWRRPGIPDPRSVLFMARPPNSVHPAPMLMKSTVDVTTAAPSKAEVLVRGSAFHRIDVVGGNQISPPVTLLSPPRRAPHVAEATGNVASTAAEARCDIISFGVLDSRSGPTTVPSAEMCIPSVLAGESPAMSPGAVRPELAATHILPAPQELRELSSPQPAVDQRSVDCTQHEKDAPARSVPGTVEAHIGILSPLPRTRAARHASVGGSDSVRSVSSGSDAPMQVSSASVTPSVGLASGTAVLPLCLTSGPPVPAGHMLHGPGRAGSAPPDPHGEATEEQFLASPSDDGAMLSPLLPHSPELSEADLAIGGWLSSPNEPMGGVPVPKTEARLLHLTHSIIAPNAEEAVVGGSPASSSWGGERGCTHPTPEPRAQGRVLGSTPTDCVFHDAVPVPAPDVPCGARGVYSPLSSSWRHADAGGLLATVGHTQVAALGATAESPSVPSRADPVGVTVPTRRIEAIRTPAPPTKFDRMLGEVRALPGHSPDLEDIRRKATERSSLRLQGASGTASRTAGMDGTALASTHPVLLDPVSCSPLRTPQQSCGFGRDMCVDLSSEFEAARPGTLLPSAVANASVQGMAEPQAALATPVGSAPRTPPSLISHSTGNSSTQLHAMRDLLRRYGIDDICGGMAEEMALWAEGAATAEVEKKVAEYAAERQQAAAEVKVLSTTLQEKSERLITATAAADEMASRSRTLTEQYSVLRCTSDAEVAHLKQKLRRYAYDLQSSAAALSHCKGVSQEAQQVLLESEVVRHALKTTREEVAALHDELADRGALISRFTHEAADNRQALDQIQGELQALIADSKELVWQRDLYKLNCARLEEDDMGAKQRLLGVQETVRALTDENERLWRLVLDATDSLEQFREAIRTPSPDDDLPSPPPSFKASPQSRNTSLERR